MSPSGVISEGVPRLPQQVRSAISGVMRRDPTEWTPDDVSVLRRELFSDSAQQALGGVELLTGSSLQFALGRMARGNGEGYFDEVRRAAAQWNELESPSNVEANTAFVDELFQRDPESWTPQETALLVNRLFDAPGDVRVPVEPLLQHAPGLKGLLTRLHHPQNRETGIPIVRRYVAAWNAGRVAPATRAENHAIVDAVMRRDVATWTPEDILGLQLRMLDAPEGASVDVPELGSVQVTFPEVLAALLRSNDSERYRSTARRFALQWREMVDGPATLEQNEQLVRDTVQRNPDAWNDDDFAQVAHALFDAPASHRPDAGPRLIMDRPDFETVLYRAARGFDRDKDDLQAYATGWRIALDPEYRAEVAKELRFYAEGGALTTAARHAAQSTHDIAIDALDGIVGVEARKPQLTQIRFLTVASLLDEAKINMARDPGFQDAVVASSKHFLETGTRPSRTHIEALFEFPKIATDVVRGTTGAARSEQLDALSGLKRISYRYEVNWRLDADPEFRDRITQSVELYLDDDIPWPAETQRALAVYPDIVNKVLEAKPDLQRALAFSKLLSISERAVGSRLESLKASLPDSAVPGFDSLLAETRHLIEDNIQITKGILPEGRVRGYSTAPEYSDFGKIQANIAMLHELARDATKQSSPTW